MFSLVVQLTVQYQHQLLLDPLDQADVITNNDESHV